MSLAEDQLESIASGSVQGDRDRDDQGSEMASLFTGDANESIMNAQEKASLASDTSLPQDSDSIADSSHGTHLCLSHSSYLIRLSCPFCTL